MRFLTICMKRLQERNNYKGGSRKKKIDLIETMNSEWRDLYPDII